MSLLPSRLDVSSSPDEPRVLDIDGDDAGDTFAALGSETAREMLSLIYEDPRTPAELEDHVGTSLQNVHYHVDRLEDADLIEPAGTGYSEKGNEMTVYGPASEAVVLFAGDEDDGSRLRDHLKRLFGLAATVAVATIVFAVAHDWLTEDPSQEQVTFQSTTDAAESADSGAAALTALDPVLAFFLGACAVAVAVAAWWYLYDRL
ncbi:ArsR/SmtB family transcription factor [Natronomonas amylolytica]|uniref:ArsR/SmtB family transcription factor n=1 Tax=Natronomonas amylolytica TaxID=3108498 RepID=UPI00300B238B